MGSYRFRGELHAPDGASAPMDIVVRVASVRGLKSGQGVIDVPASLVGSITGGMLKFVTEDGETIDLFVSRHDIISGKAMFKTSGPLPERRGVA